MGPEKQPTALDRFGAGVLQWVDLNPVQLQTCLSSHVSADNGPIFDSFGSQVCFELVELVRVLLGQQERHAKPDGTRPFPRFEEYKLTCVAAVIEHRRADRVYILHAVLVELCQLLELHETHRSLNL